MEIALTLVDAPRPHVRRDVLLRCPEGTRVAEVLPHLLAILHDDGVTVTHPPAGAGPGPHPSPPGWGTARRDLEQPPHACRLAVAGRALAPADVVGLPPLLMGAEILVGDAVAAHGGVAACRAGAAADGGAPVDHVPDPDTADSAPAVGTASALELRVVGGPDSGAVHLLPGGATTIGRDAAVVDLPISDPGVSRAHAQLIARTHGVFLRDLNSANGTRSGAGVVGEAAVPLAVGEEIMVGWTTLTLHRRTQNPTAARPLGGGYLRINRAPRPGTSTQPVELQEPLPPIRREPATLPWLAMLAPLAFAVPMALLFDSWLYLLLGLMSPVLALGNVIGERHVGSRRSRRERRVFQDRRSRLTQRVTELLAAERAVLESDYPDPAELLSTAVGRREGLWARRRDDPRRLRVRLGTGTLPSTVVVTGPDPDGGPSTAHRRVVPLTDAPVSLNLLDVGVFGLAGGRARVLAVARHLLGQIAGWHTPTDVAMILLVSDTDAVGPDQPAETWSWARWLPHLRQHPYSTPSAVRVAVGSRQAAGLVTEIADLVAARQAQTSRLAGVGRGDTATWPGAVTVVLVDGAADLRSVPGLMRLLAEGPKFGVVFVCLDENPGHLPVECGALLRLDPLGTTGRLHVAGERPLDPLVVAGVSWAWADRLARGLAPLLEGCGDRPDDLPAQARLLELVAARHGLDPASPEQLARLWSRTAAGSAPDTEALLGIDGHGAFTVDLREDGPHVLVAGTTGAGKSELLQTLVCSLATGNAPDRLGVVLVDYKGGAALAGCARLPHTLGLVTDLDEHLSRRVLTSLQAELRRRERLFRQCGAVDLQGYWSAVRQPECAGRQPPGEGGPTGPLPRLVVVVDEFRALAEELPDFVSGLVRLACVGRSLGLHLVLATQRPAGVVSQDIRANMNLRIALRVRDRPDSEDVVDAPDAAYIGSDTPGRAVARSASRPLMSFQTARVSVTAGTPDGDAVAAMRLPGPLWFGPSSAATEPPSRSGGQPDPAQPDPEQPDPEQPDPEESDLDRLVASAQRAAALCGIDRVRPPWLPALPDRLILAALRGAHPEGDTGTGPQVPYGLLDDPATQSQRRAVWRLHEGHLAIVGDPRSGRSTALLTLGCALAERFSPAQAHLHVLDGGGSLSNLSLLSNVGTLLDRREPAAARRLVEVLTEELSARRDRHAGAGLTGRPAGPHIVLAIDGWEIWARVFDELDGGRTLEQLSDLARDGTRLGIHLAVAGDRSILTSRLGAVFTERLVLRMTDHADLVLAGVPSRAVPRCMPPGRAMLLSARDRSVLEVQVALGDVHTVAPPRNAVAVAPLGRPPRIRALPRTASAATLMPGTGGPPRGRFALVGVGGDAAEPVGLDLDLHPLVLVAGPGGSGRTTALCTMAWSLAGSGTPVALVSARPGPLDALGQDLDGVSVVHGTGTAPAERLAALLTAATSPRPSTAGPAGRRPLVLLVDDVEQVVDPLESLLVQAVERAPSTGLSVIAAGATDELAVAFRGVVPLLRRGRTGLVLRPGRHVDPALFDARLPPSDSALPGRGLLVVRSTVTPVQVACTGGMRHAATGS